ncbi:MULTISPECIES: TetR/AcrR family transcriptional regulator [unclassified Actinobaculum]|uniref:TetR/AcrR family transcriptional regulator n=1 Tax=unclassified Actinobaculum TaxID=2609299 RepID=UPI000D525C99|nr:MULTISPECIES: TetR/AcrR family transcriptional regulator [unclassified Actinobaculum]AWE43270.1 hypothetical protein DDD63_11515 [Actinobaculum sp. 313]RTE49837.1 TetR/AcrR family transcriptional regulator [Actinobaculum sp. 352]
MTTARSSNQARRRSSGPTTDALMRPSTSSQNTADRLVSACIEIIDEVGWSHVELAAVTRACSVSTPAIYSHFAGKEELLQAALTEVSHRMQIEAAHRMQHALPPDADADPNGVLLNAAEQIVDTAVHHPHLLDFLLFSPFSLEALRDTTSQTAAFPFLSAVQEAIDLLLPEGPDKLRQQVFLAVWSAIQGYSKLVASGAAHHNPDFLARTLNALLTMKEGE